MATKPSPKLIESLAELREQGIQFLPIAKLKPWAGNPNRHDPGTPRLVRLMQRFGWTQPAIIRRDADPDDRHEVSAGHGRAFEAAVELGLEEVPVIFRNFTAHESHASGLADNKAPEFSLEDPASLQAAIDALIANDGLDDVLDAGWTSEALDELAASLPGDGEGDGDGDPGPKATPPSNNPGDDELPEKVPAVSKLGDDIEVGRHRVVCGDCLDVLKSLPDCSVDSIVTDPPYGIGFMGKGWDVSVPGAEWAAECLRVLKPGGHIIAFAATRTVHRLGTIVEDAGFEIRDIISWMQWQGFPKSLDVSKAIDKAAGAEREVVGQRTTGIGTGKGATPFMGDSANRDITAPATDAAKQWDGWGTGLKPSHEPALLARKPLSGTVAETILEHGTGGINIDGCRIPYGDKAWPGPGEKLELQSRDVGESGKDSGVGAGITGNRDGHRDPSSTLGRFPANIYVCPKPARSEREEGTEGETKRPGGSNAKGYTKDVARGLDRNRPVGNSHPTVKPVGLMRWLVRLVTPPGGTVLEPFLGSGTTLIACEREGFRGIGVEFSPEYMDIALARVRKAVSDA